MDRGCSSGVAAAIIRELAAAYLLAMMVMAFKDGCRKEAAAWAIGLVIFAAALAVHAHDVNALVTASDPASPSWLRIGGWSFVLQTTQWNLLLEAAPRWLGVIVVPLALAGLTGRRDDVGQRVMLVVFGYVAAFIFVGRDNNSYWGLMIAPLWPLGLVTAWPALVQWLHRSPCARPKGIVASPRRKWPVLGKIRLEFRTNKL